MGRWGSGGRQSPRAPALVSEAPRAPGAEKGPSPLLPPKLYVPAQQGPPGRGVLLFSMGRVSVSMAPTASKGFVDPWVTETQNEAGVGTLNAYRGQAGDVNGNDH